MTQSGIDVMIPAILLKIPKKINQQPQAYPARREAHLVRAMTPLFCEKVVLGMVVVKPEIMDEIASASKPPWILQKHKTDKKERGQSDL